MIKHVCTLTVRYAETDQMQFAHHSNYIVWFEHARIQLMNHYGISYAKLEQDGFLMPVLEVNARFIKYAVFDETLKIETSLPEIPGAKLRFLYNVYNTHEELICNGSSLHAFINLDKKAIKPPKELLKILRPHYKA